MMTVKQAAAALQIDWFEKDVSFTGVSTDSRTLKSGDLFIALSGKISRVANLFPTQSSKVLLLRSSMKISRSINLLSMFLF